MNQLDTILSQYAPLIIIAIAAIVAYVVGHHVGGKAAVPAAPKPEVVKTDKVDEPPKTKLEQEVDKTHAALDAAGIYGTARLDLITRVRYGEVTGDDVARAHPAPVVAKPAEIKAEK